MTVAGQYTSSSRVDIWLVIASERRKPDETSEPTRGHYLCYGHMVVLLGRLAIDNPHRIASIQGDTDDLEDRLSDNVRGNATKHDHPHGTGGNHRMFNIRNDRVDHNLPSKGNCAHSQDVCYKIEGILL